ncbi:MAG: hypothetical protein HDS78_07540 [Bacteroidales bacterium]|nr:hypothetical protein [Bacteroidales bacterium]
MTIKEYRNKLIEKYYSENPGFLNENETVKTLSKNTECIVTNMSLEEYVKKTGYKTYGEIKKELGL